MYKPVSFALFVNSRSFCKQKTNVVISAGDYSLLHGTAAGLPAGRFGCWEQDMYTTACLFNRIPSFYNYDYELLDSKTFDFNFGFERRYDCLKTAGILLILILI